MMTAKHLRICEAVVCPLPFPLIPLHGIMAKSLQLVPKMRKLVYIVSTPNRVYSSYSTQGQIQVHELRS